MDTQGLAVWRAGLTRALVSASDQGLVSPLVPFEGRKGRSSNFFLGLEPKAEAPVESSNCVPVPFLGQKNSNFLRGVQLF